MPAALYNRDILRLAASIPFLQRLDGPNASVEKRASPCGSRVLVDVIVDGQGRVERFGQTIQACALGQASAALLGAHVVGRRQEELAGARDRLRDYLEGAREDPGDWPGLTVFADARGFTARHAAILLPFEAASEALAAAGPGGPKS